MRVQGLAAGLVLLAAVPSAGECPLIVPLVVVGGACVGQDGAATPSALHAQAAALVATAVQDGCPRAQPGDTARRLQLARDQPR